MGSDTQDRSFILHLEDFEDIADLKDADAGKLLKAILVYVETGVPPEKMGTQVKTMFGFIRRHIERDKAHYKKVTEERSKAGKKGGRPRKKKNQQESNESKEKQIAFEEKQKKQMVFSESKKSYPDPDPDPDPVPDPVPVPESDAQACAPKNGFVPDEKERNERIRFLRTMIKLYDTGALTDYGDYQMWRDELRTLEMGR